MPGTAAARAGIRTGDVITSIDNQEITDFEDLREAVRQHQVGDRVQVHVTRDGSSLTIEAELGPLPQKT